MGVGGGGVRRREQKKGKRYWIGEESGSKGKHKGWVKGA